MPDSPALPKVNDEQTAIRRPWSPLDFEKIDAKDAEVGFFGTGSDNTFYS